MIILQIVTDRTNITVTNTYEVTSGFSIVIFIIDSADSKGQGHAHFDC